MSVTLTVSLSQHTQLYNLPNTGVPNVSIFIVAEAYIVSTIIMQKRKDVIKSVVSFIDSSSMFSSTTLKDLSKYVSQVGECRAVQLLSSVTCYGE